MQIKKYENSAADSLLILMSEEDCGNLSFISNVNSKLKDLISDLISRKDFTGKKGNLFRVSLFDSNFKNLYLIGLGKSEKINLNLIRDSLAWGLRSIGKQHNKNAVVILENLKNFEKLSFALGEASGLCGYVFDKYKSKDEHYEPFSLEEIFCDVYEPEEFEKGLKFADAQIFSREIANEPGCAVWPEVLAQKAQELSKKYNRECEVCDEVKLKSERMGALLAVGSGSKNPPRFVHSAF